MNPIAIAPTSRAIASPSTAIARIVPEPGAPPALVRGVSQLSPLGLGGLELSAFQLGLLGLELATVLLGLRIAHVAIRGYRRNESDPMLYVAVGFVLLVGVPALLSGVYLATGLVPQRVLGVVGSVSEVCGMASILYGLRGP